MAAIIAAKSTFRSRTFSTPTPDYNRWEPPCIHYRIWDHRSRVPMAARYPLGLAASECSMRIQGVECCSKTGRVRRSATSKKIFARRHHADEVSLVNADNSRGTDHRFALGGADIPSTPNATAGPRSNGRGCKQP